MEREYEKVKGRIFDIQRFSIHDGPGIRTIVFLKGCILRCRWCCNPESQEYEIQQMEVNGKQEIIGRDVTVQEVIKEVVKDRIYYRRSCGGLTLSGGEALCQPEFTRALLICSKKAGIHTAMESTANVPFAVIEDLLPHLDDFLLDIKHMDAKKHFRYTGVENEMILENAGKIASSNTNLVIRVPVIPTFNHTHDEILDIIRFVKTLPSVRRLHLLPYHRLGQDKYAGLGREYLMDAIKPLDIEYMEGLQKLGLDAGLDCRIGG